MKAEKTMNPTMIEQITKTAVQTTLEYLEKEKQREKKAKRDWRRRNIKLLLKNYRSFVAHSEDTKEKLTMLHYTEAMDELNSEDFAVESIKRSKQRTLAMVQFMQRMLNVYQVMCESSGQLEELRRYKVIHAVYISEEKMTFQRIAECQKIDERTIYRDINDACKTLSVLIFGVDGIQFE